MKQTNISTGLLAACLMATGFLTTSLAAQEPQREDYRGTGKIVGVRGNLLYVEATDSSKWIVQAPENLDNFSVTKTAHPSVLKPGMFAMFTTKFDKKGVHEGELNEVTLFTPSEEEAVGVFQKSEFTPSLKSVFGSDDKPRVESASFLVRGKIGVLKDGVLTLRAGRSSVKVNISEAVNVKVDVNDPRFIVAGDDIEFNGWYTTRGQLVAQRVRVTSKQTLGAPAAEPVEPKPEQ